MKAKTTVEVGAELRVRRCPERLREGMILATRIPHPDAAGAKRSGRTWRGDRFWSPCRKDGADLVVPRGLLDTLRSRAAACRVRLAFDSRVTGQKGIPRIPIDRFALTPRDYQVRAIEKMHRGTQGVIVLPCGGGKTVLGALALASLGQPGIVLVHTTDLIDQWESTLNAVGGVEVRVVGGGRRDDGEPLRPGQVAVVSVHSAHTVPELMASAAAVLMDEAHRVPGGPWSQAMAMCSARWRWALTATPDRADGWGCLLGATFGPVLMQMRSVELIRMGHLRRPLVIPVSVPWSPPEDCFGVEVRCGTCGRITKTSREKLEAGEAMCRARKACGRILNARMGQRRGKLMWGAVLTRWAESAEALTVIRRLSVAADRAGRRNLTLVPRKSAAEKVARALSRKGIDAAAVTSNTAAREAVIDRFRSGRVSAMVGTQLADEGLDVRDADLLIMASLGRASGVTEQRAGRICRPGGHERPVVYDLVPEGLPYQWDDRLYTYRDAFGAEAIFSDQPVSLDEAIRALPR